MRGILSSAAALAVATLLAGPAWAELPFIGGPLEFYIGGEGGWTHLPDQTDRVASNLPADYHVKYDSGFNVGARLGFQWGPWRLEEEYNYRQNNNRYFDVGGVVPPHLSGNRHSHAIMTNILYDFLFLHWPVVPYVGAGVGAFEVVDRVKTTPTGLHLININWLAGYQAIAGLRYDIHPNVSFEVDYRFLTPSRDPSFWVASNTPPPGWIHYHTGYNTHNVVASLVFRCCASAPPVVPPPPPPPPPPPVSRQVFLVFFDWDRDVITPEGMRILGSAADAWKSGAPVRIQVTGYADRSGSPGYNQRLSERRAANVATALAGLSVPREQMTVTGRGENDNRVPTADGVREPQNRRVEIGWP